MQQALSQITPVHVGHGRWAFSVCYCMQDLNPLPFAATILNCSGWVVYTVLVRNWFVFCTDAPGLLCSIWMTFSLYPHATLRVSSPNSSKRHVPSSYRHCTGAAALFAPPVGHMQHAQTHCCTLNMVFFIINKNCACRSRIS